jgi:hypothetical protein
MAFRLNAAARLIESKKSMLDKVLCVEKLYADLKARNVPAVLNKVDHTILFRYEMPNVVQALKYMGWRKSGIDGTSVYMQGPDCEVKLYEPRAGWNPVLKVID